MRSPVFMNKALMCFEARVSIYSLKERGRLRPVQRSKKNFAAGKPLDQIRVFGCGDAGDKMRQACGSRTYCYIFQNIQL